MKNIHAKDVTSEMVPGLRLWLGKHSVSTSDVVECSTTDFETFTLTLFQRDEDGKILVVNGDVQLYTLTITDKALPTKIRTYFSKGFQNKC